ncbi:hypothetical protein [Actinokineospora sp. NPDC004072]
MGEGSGRACPRRVVAAAWRIPTTTNPGFLAHRVELRELYSDGFATDERVEAEQAAQRIANLLADASLVERLRRDGFCGPAYEIFTVVLTGYGLPVTRA